MLAERGLDFQVRRGTGENPALDLKISGTELTRRALEPIRLLRPLAAASGFSFRQG